MLRLHEEDSEEDFKRRKNLLQIKIRKENRKGIFRGFRKGLAQLNDQDYNGISICIGAEKEQEEKYKDEQQTKGEEESRERAKERCNPEDKYGKGVTDPEQNKEQTQEYIPTLHQSKAIDQSYDNQKVNNISSKEWQLERTKETKIIIQPSQQIRTTISKIMSNRYSLEDLASAMEWCQLPENIYLNHKGIIIIRKLLGMKLSEQDLIINSLLDNDLLTVFIQMIQQDVYKQLKLESMWILANITATERYFCQKLVQRGLITVFVKILKEGEKYVVDHALIALGNIAADSKEYKQQMFQANCVEVVIKLGEETLNKSFFLECAWFLINIISGIDYQTNKHQIKRGVEFLCKALVVGYLNDCEEYDRVVSILFFYWKHIFSILADFAVIPYIIDHCNKNERLSKQVRLTAIKFISKYSEGSESDCQYLIDHGIFDLIHKFLLSVDSPTVSLSLYTLSNLAAGKKQHVDMILQHEDLLSITKWCIQSKEWSVQYEACFVLGNICCHGSPIRILQYYREIDVIDLIMELLKQENSELQQLFNGALIFLTKVLEVGEKQTRKFNGKNIFREEIISSSLYLERLFSLQSFNSKQVYIRIQNIIKQYFYDFYDINYDMPL